MKTTLKTILIFSIIFIKILICSNTLLLAQTISVQPTDQNICNIGTPVTFTVKVTKEVGKGNILTSNWEVNRNDGNNWVMLTSPAPQGDFAEYTISHTINPTVAADLNSQYRAVLKEGNFAPVYSVSVKITNSTPAAPATSGDFRTGTGTVTLKASGAPAGGSYKWYTASTGGSAISGATNAIYTPNLTANATTTVYTFYVSAVNGSCESPRTAVTATVYPDLAPIVANDVITNMALISSNDGQKPLDVLSSSYPEGTTSPYTASYTIIALPASTQGKLYVNGVAATANQTLTPAQAKQLTFDPEATFYGTASFTFRATDDKGVSSANEATYSIPINAVPVAYNVTTGSIPTSNQNRYALNLLNATDADGSISKYVIESLPNQGTLYTTITNGTALAVGDIINTNQLYFFPTNTNGTPTFTFSAIDNKGAKSTPATHYLYVGNVTTPPTAANITIATMPNTYGSTTISPLSATGGTTTYTYRITSLPTSSQGILYVDGQAANTTTNYTQAQASNLKFDPDPTFSGNASFTYTATSSNSTSPSATYTIPVTYPPVAKDITSLINSAAANPLSIAPLAATDQDGSISNFIITSLPASTQGKLTLYGVDVTGNQVLTPLQAKDLKFEKATTFASPATFTYNATDNMGIKAVSTATYTIKTSTPLPVELAYFTGTYNGSDVTLKWLTASEKNNEKFIIERSSNGRTFEAIGQVAGQGDSFQAIRYSFTDQSPAGKQLYYRLKQVDFDGTITYSKIIALTASAPESQPGLVAYPNPTKGLCTSIVTALEAGNAHIRLIDLQSHVVLQKLVYLKKGLTEIPLDLQHTASGIYLLQVQTGKHIQQTKVLISR